MEKEIDKYFGSIDQAVEYLLKAKARGEHVFCDYNGHKLHSDNVTLDSAYVEILGCTKYEYENKQEKWMDDYKRKIKDTETREQRYADMVKENREKSVNPVTMPLVVSGLKFIAENQSLSQDELISGLLKIGCNFTLEDINKQIPADVDIFKGMQEGSLKAGASVIVNVRDSEFGRSYCEDTFLSLDDENSLYNFIRVTTGNSDYTKEYVDSLKNEMSR